MRFFKMILEVVAWINIFIIPSIIFELIGYACYAQNRNDIGIIIMTLLSIVGLGLGVFVAEKVRRTIGCSSAVFKIFSSNDVTEWTSTKKGEG